MEHSSPTKESGNRDLGMDNVQYLSHISGTLL